MRLFFQLIAFFLLAFFTLEVSSQVTEEEDSICKSYIKLAKKYTYKNPDSALYFAERTYQFSKSLKHQKGLASAYSRYGILYRNQGEYAKAIDYLDSAVTVFEVIGDTVWQAHSLQMIGSVYFNKGEYTTQIEYLLSAISLFEEIKANRSIAFAYNHIGSAYQNLVEFDKAKNYFNQSIQLFSEIPDSAGMMGPLNNIGLIYERLDSLEKSLHYYQQANQINELYVNNRSMAVIVKGNIAGIYHKMGNNQEAFNSFESVLKITQINNFPKEKATAQIGKGNSALALNKVSIARNLADSGYRILKEIGAKKNIINALNLKIEIAKQTDSHQDLAPLYQELMLYKDSILNEEKTNRLAELEVQYETEKKELQIKQQQRELIIAEQEKGLQTAYSIFIGAGLLLLIIILFLLYNRQKLYSKNQTISKKLIEEELKNSELEKDKLQESVELHQQEIAATTLSMVRKNEQIEKLRIQIKNLDQNDQKALELKMKIKENEVADKEWNKFNLHFSKMHPHFYDSLLEKNSKCTSSELRLAALMKMSLSNREIAEISGVSTRSIDQNKYRLKKKLNLTEEVKLIDFIRSI